MDPFIWVKKSLKRYSKFILKNITVFLEAVFSGKKEKSFGSITLAALKNWDTP
jgi:hypothetical protein